MLPFLSLAEVCKSLYLNLNNSNAKITDTIHETWGPESGFLVTFFVLEHQKVFKFTFTLSISDSTYKSLPRENKAQRK